MKQLTDDKSAGRAEILRTLSTRGPMSQAELARNAALAPSTVSGIVASLRAEGILGEAPRTAAAASGPKGGRPGTVLALQPSLGTVAGIDFGKKHVRVAIADLGHNILVEKVSLFVPDAPAAQHIELAGALLDEALQELNLDKTSVINVGVGIPGPVHKAAGDPVDSAILPGWRGVNVSKALNVALDLPIRIANDANLGALSEWMWGAARGCSDVAYLKISTGIGGGLILGGNPYWGSGGTAGEIGHTIIDPLGRFCRCGNRGCLETIAGAETILRTGEKIAPGLTVTQLIQLARQGETTCIKALSDAGHAIGIALAMLCNLINPECVVVGGEMASAGELLLDPINASFRQAALTSVAGDLTVIRGSLGEQAEVLGAVAIALRNAVSPRPHPGN
ncbi:ROK family transcriptional regulator [Arthrobacter sp. SLBN-100]|uniref:ROK family transcriptional regulator n=1 Tax=Arthrobacter sp. SLBN-100 TaxID=2768450 RepID=UPI00135B1461|nr:ROK family transcriptional regulator [Arthrobacter sp. SLBN-100]